jgi:hypothetical protein
MKTGLMRERVRFYVWYRQLPEAMDIVAELFALPCEEDNNED